MIVMKFGGTSNQDAAAMRNVISIVQSHLELRPIVVISAIAKATNELEQTARMAAAGRDAEAEKILDGLFSRHETIIENLLKAPDNKRDLKEVIGRYRATLGQLIKGVAILGELTPRTMDAFCSFGERLSSQLIAAGLREAKVDCIWVDVKDFMITDDNFGRARPVMEKVKARLEEKVAPLVQEGKVVVTQGFIGVTESGAYTTMGRESSDYSASIIGAALEVEKVQIWTDVDGILTADPRVVKQTRKVRQMSFEEAFELSYFGAKVLHPNTMLPVIEKEIPVQIINSKNNRSLGTLVDVVSTPSLKPLVKSIAYKKAVTVITVSPDKRLGQYLFWESIFSILSRHGIGSGLMTTSEYSIAFTVDSKSDVARLESELSDHGRVRVFPGKASLCLVGEGLRGTNGLADRVFAALSSMNVTMVSFGASGLNMSIVIDDDQVENAVIRLHREFFEGEVASEVFDVPAN
jgi:aspartate kinase